MFVYILVLLGLFARPTAAQATAMTCNLDVVFLVDGSESVIEQDFSDIIIPFLVNVSENLLGDPGMTTRVAAIEFSDIVTEIVSDFVADADVFEASLDAFEQSSGLTFTASALLTALNFIEENSDTTRVPAVVVVSDGVISDEDRSNLASALEGLNSQVIHRVVLNVDSEDPQAGVDGIAIAGEFGALEAVPSIFNLTLSLADQLAELIKKGCGTYCP